MTIGRLPISAAAIKGDAPVDVSWEWEREGVEERVERRVGEGGEVGEWEVIRVEKDWIEDWVDMVEVGERGFWGEVGLVVALEAKK